MKKFIELLLIPFSIFSWGFVTLKFYSWFILSVFHFMPEINYVHALGLYTFMSLFKNHNIYEVKKEYRSLTEDEKITMQSLMPWVLLLLGFLIHLL